MSTKVILPQATDILGGVGGAGGGLAGAFGMYSKTPMEKAIRVAIEESVRLIVAKTPKDYYRVPATPVPTATLRTPEKQTQPQQAQPQPQTQQQAALPPPPPVVSPPLPVVTPPPSLPEHPQRTTQVTVSHENLREKPQGKIVGRVNKGTTLVILEEIEKWLRVRLEDGSEAWIWKASTTEGAKAAPTPTTTPTTQKGKSPM